MFDGIKTLTSWNGRLKRLPYFMVIVVIFIAVTILGAIFGGTMGKVIAYAGQILLIPSQIKRMHDIGWNPWFLLLSLLPFVGFILAVLLLFVPGKK